MKADYHNQNDFQPGLDSYLAAIAITLGIILMSGTLKLAGVFSSLIKH